MSGFHGPGHNGPGHDAPGFRPPVPGTLPRSLVIAVVTVVQAELVAAGHLTWFGSGLAPEGTALPYASFADADETTPLDALGGRRVEGQIVAQVFAPDKDDAEDLGELLADALDAAWTAGRLRSRRGGDPTFWWAGDRSSIQDPDDADGGGPVWIHTRTFQFKLTT